MQLVKTKIENFRSYQSVEFELPKLSVIIGKNDVGKSTILDALNIFFENEKPLDNDANVYSVNKEISITCLFRVETNMPIFLDSAESENTQTTLDNEYLLDNNGLLQIKKVFEKGKLKNIFIVANYPNNWDKPLIALRITDLKKEVEKFENQNVNKTIKKAMREFLFNKQESLNLNIQEINVNSKESDSDIANIYEKIKLKLPKFMLFRADRTNTDKDAEVTDITKAISKNAVAEVEQQFMNIKQEIKQKIQDFSNQTLEKLKSFNEDIANSLSVNMQDKALESIFSYEFKSDDEIPFNKRGSGVKRLFLLSFFIADSERQNHSNMIYAIEEPETSQHPDFQRKIIETLKTISQNDNRQVLITTHTPEIVKLVGKDEVIFVTKDENNARQILQKETLYIKQAVETLGILPYVSYKGVLFVEGENDIKFFKNLNKIDCLNKIFNIDDIAIIPLRGSKNIENWIRQDYLRGSNIKQIYFKDRDEGEQENIIEQDNIKVITTQKREIENYYPIDIVENYFKSKLELDFIFSENDKKECDNEDIAKIISQRTTKFNEQTIKKMFNCKDIWLQISEDNLQNFDEIKSWFETMRDFFI